MDFFVDNIEYDLELDGRDLRMTTTDEDVISRVKAFMQFNDNSWFLNTSRGLPITSSFIEPDVDMDKVNMLIRLSLEGLEGVDIVNEITLTPDYTTRILYGTIVVNKTITVEV